MTIIWLRHAEKLFENGQDVQGYHKHDPPIRRIHTNRIRTICENIVSKYGVPKRIICSPFLRTRETAEAFQRYFRKNHSALNIDVDTNICEFLGWTKPKGLQADIDYVTSKYCDPILGIESTDDVNIRVENHLKELDYTDDILIITHGIVVSFVHKQLTDRTMYRVKELTGLSLHNGNIELFNGEIPIEKS